MTGAEQMSTHEKLAIFMALAKATEPPHWPRNVNEVERETYRAMAKSLLAVVQANPDRFSLKRLVVAGFARKPRRSP